ncbi:MAG: hypothetical protein ATN36_08605 [Epulopiscium sp. Nele67-Bin005]|nr:MAG: hypothetical protein ATN36_08605 [Epulopiscium sp. Nele67-Bin005]
MKGIIIMNKYRNFALALGLLTMPFLTYATENFEEEIIIEENFATLEENLPLGFEYEITEEVIEEFVEELEEEIPYVGTRIQVEDEILPLSQEPLIKDGKSYYPFRAILEAMNFEVSYEASSKLITASNDINTLKFQANAPSFLINGKVQIFNSGSAFVHTDGATYIPIRDIFEALDYTVSYNDEYQIIVLKSNNLEDFFEEDNLE